MYLEIRGRPKCYRCETEPMELEAEIEALGEAFKKKLGLRYLHLGFYWSLNDWIKRFYLISHELDVVIVYYSTGSQAHWIHHHNMLWLKCRLYWRKLLHKIGIL